MRRARTASDDSSRVWTSNEPTGGRRVRIQAVLFDIDDTLVEHTRAMRAATVALYESRASRTGLEPFLAQWKAAHGRHYPRFLRGEISYAESARARVREVLDAAATDADADERFAAYLADYERGWMLCADVLPCLDELRDLPLGVISNGRSDEQRRKLTVLGVSDRFRGVFISEEVGVAKPAPGIFERACESMGVVADRAVYVGDHYDLDACAARSAGLQGVWLNRRGTPRPGTGVPSISSLAGLRALVDP